MMKLNTKYKIKTSTSVYTGEVLEYNKPFVKIKDKYGKEISLNENDILKFYKAEE
jgi:hypothetical protein